MFHAPYYDGRNSLGQPTVNCDIGDVNLDGLNSYYTEMVGKEAGDRLFERTMSYCTAEDGWVISGNNAAELYDIATEKL